MTPAPWPAPDPQDWCILEITSFLIGETIYGYSSLKKHGRQFHAWSWTQPFGPL